MCVIILSNHASSTEQSTVAEVALAERTHNSLKVSWKEPDKTELTHYHLWIDPDDNKLSLPIRVNKYVLFSNTHFYMIHLCDKTN